MSCISKLACLFAIASAAMAASGVESTFGLDIIDAISKDPQNVVLPVLNCRLEGFENDWAPYRTPSVRRSAAGGRIVATVPSAGTFYPAFVFYDGAGDERIRISVNGSERGVAVANLDDNRQKLFFLTQPERLKAGDTIELRALTSEGTYRTEDLLLLRAKPEPRRIVHAIREVFAQPGTSGAAVTWITNWPVACVVEWKRVGGATQRVNEELAMANHRVVLTPLQPNAAYQYRITAVARDGSPVASGWQSFTTKAGPAVRGSVASARVQLQVEPSAKAVVFPVTAGVPFPKGALGSHARLRMLDSQGREAPLQTQTLARWDDGSVKWALLDAQASGGAYLLEYGSAVSRKPVSSELKVTEDAGGVTVTTGPLKFTVSKKRFGFLESVLLDGARVISPGRSGAFYLTAVDGTVYSTLSAPDEVKVEENGPLRAVVRVSGSHRAAGGRKLFAYTVRFHAYAGHRFLRVQHTFVNDFGGSDFTTIKGLSLRVPLAAGAGSKRHWALGDASQESGVLLDDGGVILKQHTDDRYAVSGGRGNAVAEGKRAAGWGEWRDRKHSVTLAVRDFWQNYPKDLAVTADGLELGLCPPLREDEYAGAKGTMDEHRIYFYLQNGGYKLRQGVSKTHDLWLDFEPAGAPPSPLRGQRWPLFATAPPAWYAASRALGELALPKPAGVIAQYDVAVARSFDAYLQNRETNREFGLLNFGDWWGERVINWGNSEYDTQHGFFLQFARTRDLRFFRAAEQMEWHNRDVDTVHSHTNAMQVGGVYLHCIGHTGDYYRESPFEGKGFPRGTMSVDHTFVEGHLDYYHLTGDRRSLETAKQTAERYDSYYTRNYDFSNCRQPGWHLTLTMALYNATNDRFYLNAAKIIIERLLERQTADGGWRRQLTVDHCQCVPRHFGNTGFMVGVLLTGLKHYYEATGDERIADSIVRAARFLINDMWVADAQAFRYTSCPRTRPTPGLNFLLFDGLVFAHRRTQDPNIARVLIEGTPSALKAMGGWGKEFTQYTRVAPDFIDHLAALADTGR